MNNFRSEFVPISMIWHNVKLINHFDQVELSKDTHAIQFRGL